MDTEVTLLQEAEKHASDIIVDLPDTLVYHNLNHTKEVVKAVQKIGAHSNVSDEEMELLLLAAWFHDTGFRDTTDGHEEASKKIAEHYLESKSYPREKIDEVINLIEATKPFTKPATKLEMIICDADFSHMAKGSYFDKMLLLRQEYKNLGKNDDSDELWNEKNMEFLKNHRYHTEYGKAVLAVKQSENANKQAKILKKLIKKRDQMLEQDLDLDPGKLKELKKKLKKVEGRPDRGIETMFRLTSRNHLQLSSMADSKANILISVNAIIISVLIGGLIKTLDNHPHLVIPTYLLLSINVITIIFAILATRPNVSKGKFTKKDIEEKKTNLLFFGNFHKMKQADYKWGMLEMMSDSDYLYSSLIDDIYFLGKVLGKKYHFLRIAYTIFMIGIILAVISYVIANMYYLAVVRI
jgi:HD superfamily phosphodiesterase